MEKQIILSPEELYYLGTVLQAKYIDYAYVAAMNDIGQNYSLFENETKASLVKSGVLIEDFGGNLEIDSEADKLIKPIFFGEIETSIDVCKIENDEGKVDVYKFHFFDGTITMVTGESGKLVIKSIDQLGIKDLVSGFVPENYSCTETSEFTEIPQENVTSFIAFKNINVGKISSVKTYIEADGVLYRQKSEDVIESVTKEAFIEDAYDTVKGV